ncbi:hypothetical protein L195_g028494 [Trifolium pratense]|uniref:Uncharacterized protein n=1 Tax=Trifolium pratense TaxID=57577 RepID=A0A2K3L250_TRIPR|nr:hypothetical protein L195_g028494 [Trifolium pratense]
MKIKPYIYWLCYLSHFKRDCPELKDNNSAHVIEGSSEYEGYEHGEALVVSSREPKESET